MEHAQMKEIVANGQEAIKRIEDLALRMKIKTGRNLDLGKIDILKSSLEKLNLKIKSK